MARSIADIKAEMVQNYLANPEVADKYPNGIGRVSIESVLFSVVAVAIYIVEALFDVHQADITEQLDAQIAHRPTWYARKAREFMLGKLLIPDTDQYDTTGMSDEDMEAAKVVKYAVAYDSTNTSHLIIKVAGEQDGARAPLPGEQQVALVAYLNEIRDAGVRIDLVNVAPETFNCIASIYYDPILQPETVQQACKEAISSYISNIEFNGEYTNQKLVDKLQLVAGVKLIDLISATYTNATETATNTVQLRYTPVAGYFVVGDLNITMIPNNQ